MCDGIHYHDPEILEPKRDGFSDAHRHWLVHCKDFTDEFKSEEQRAWARFHRSGDNDDYWSAERQSLYVEGYISGIICSQSN